MLTPLPAATPLKPGSAVSKPVFLWSFRGCPAGVLFDVSAPQTLPFFSVVPAILNESGEELEGESEGYLVRRDSSGWDAASVLMAPPVAGVQAAVARRDEDRLREPSTL